MSKIEVSPSVVCASFVEIVYESLDFLSTAIILLLEDSDIREGKKCDTLGLFDG